MIAQIEQCSFNKIGAIAGPIHESVIYRIQELPSKGKFSVCLNAFLRLA